MDRYASQTQQQAVPQGLAGLPYKDSKLVLTLLTLPAFKQAVSGATRRNAALGQAAATAMTGLAVAARFLLDPSLPPGFPYLTFFPCIIITGFIWGLLPALTSSVLCLLAAWYWFIPPFATFDLNTSAATALLSYVVVVSIDLGLLQIAIYTAASQVKAQLALAAALRLQQVVSEEVDHRMKNLLAAVNGLISLSQRHTTSASELAGQLRQRISAMSGSIGLLRGAAHGEMTSVAELVVSSVHPLGVAVGERFRIEGGSEVLRADVIVPLSLMLHELTTNSLKYGALSNAVGTVSLKTRVAPSTGDQSTLELVWAERDGPRLLALGNPGFGTTLLKKMAQALGGTCDFSLDPTGLSVCIKVDCAQVLH